jgi:hypothetical protein
VHRRLPVTEKNTGRALVRDSALFHVASMFHSMFQMKRRGGTPVPICPEDFPALRMEIFQVIESKGKACLTPGDCLRWHGACIEKHISTTTY